MADNGRKTYSLGSGQLHFKKGDKECFCALGVYGAERGVSVRRLDVEDYSVFADHMDDLKRMAEILTPHIGLDLEEWGASYDAAVLTANDKRDYGVPYVSGKTRPFVVPVEKVAEALKAVGIDVELNDVRGEELTWMNQE